MLELPQHFAARIPSQELLGTASYLPVLGQHSKELCQQGGCANLFLRVDL